MAGEGGEEASWSPASSSSWRGDGTREVTGIAVFVLVEPGWHQRNIIALTKRSFRKHTVIVFVLRSTDSVSDDGDIEADKFISADTVGNPLGIVNKAYHCRLHHESE